MSYEHYVESITKTPLANPVDPPLTLVSRLLRTEALPVFYNMCPFQITSGEDAAGFIIPNRPNRKFFDACTEQKLANMRKFDIKVVVGYHCGASRRVEVANASVIMSPSAVRYEIKIGATTLGRRPEVEGILEEDITKKMDAIMAIKEGNKLSAQRVLKLGMTGVGRYVATGLKVLWI